MRERVKRREAGENKMQGFLYPNESVKRCRWASTWVF